jgi:hypothetical protein
LTPSQEQKISYGDWLIDQLGMLAVSKGAPQTRERLAINAADLMDIPQEIMRGVFERARKEKTFGYPQVSDLRALAGVQEKQLEGCEADRMWVWLTREYLPQFGIDGRDKAVAVVSEAERANCQKCGATGFVMVEQESRGRKTQVAARCECRRCSVVHAPQIPPRLRYALQQLGVTPRDAMVRILDCEPEKQGFLLKEFHEAYEGAIDAERSGELLTSSPDALLLPDEFSSGLQTLIARKM